MYKLLMVAAVTVVVSVLGAGNAHAQRDARGLGIQKPYYGSGGGGRSYSYRGGSTFNYAQPSYNYAAPQPTIASEPGYRTFSFEPLGIHPQDNVVVNRDNVKLMLGRQAIATAPKGLEFKVAKVVNGWLGAIVTLDGKEHRGWIWSGNVRPVSTAPAAPPDA